MPSELHRDGGALCAEWPPLAPRLWSTGNVGASVIEEWNIWSHFKYTASGWCVVSTASSENCLPLRSLNSEPQETAWTGSELFLSWWMPVLAHVLFVQCPHWVPAGCIGVRSHLVRVAARASAYPCVMRISYKRVWRSSFWCSIFMVLPLMKLVE